MWDEIWAHARGGDQEGLRSPIIGIRVLLSLMIRRVHVSFYAILLLSPWLGCEAKTILPTNNCLEIIYLGSQIKIVPEKNMVLVTYPSETWEIRK